MKIDVWDNSVKIELSYSEVNNILSIDPYPKFFGSLTILQKELEKAMVALDANINTKLEKAKAWVGRATTLINNWEQFNLSSNFWTVLYIEESFKREFAHMGFSLRRIIENKEIVGFELLNASGNKVDLS